MSNERPMPCPAPDELERSMGAAELEPRLEAHLRSCADCREKARLIRENLEFMGRFLGEIGPGTMREARPVAEPGIMPGYRLVREIARGGQGVVYEATQVETKRRVAVKMIEPGPGGTGKDARAGRGRRRIEREAEISAGLRHPNIVTVYDSAALPDGRYALAMEFVEGATLDGWAREIDLAATRDRGSLKEAVRVKLRAFAAVCDAVQYAHLNGVIHRDLKPANVLMTAQGVPRVVDFGIARRIALSEGITLDGEFAGTLAYASPERVSGDPEGIDTRSDVYSLGVMLYELLAARRPYATDRSLTGAVANIATSDPDPLDTVEPGAQPSGEELRTIVYKALAKDRTQRYQTAGALKADVENWLAGRALDAKRESAFYVLRKTATRHRIPFAVAAGFLVLLTAFAIAMAWSAGRLDRQRRLLAASLSTSTVERGRLLGNNDANARAESLIWPELIRSGADPADAMLGFDSPPDATQAAWALFELYSRHATLMHLSTIPGIDGLVFERGETVVRAVHRDGAQEIRSIPDGALLERTPPIFTTVKSKMVMYDHDCRRAVGFGGPTTEVLDYQRRERRELGDPLLADLWYAELSTDGSRLLTIGPDGTLRLWQTEPLRRIADLGSNLLRENRARLSGDGRLLVAGFPDCVKMFRTEDGSPVGSWAIPEDVRTLAVRGIVNVAQISPDGRRLAVGFSTWVLIFNANDREAPPVRIAAHRGFVNYVAFSPDSSKLLSTGYERDFRIWDLETGQRLASFEQTIGWRGQPAISQDGSLIATCDVEDRLRVWQTRQRAWLSRLDCSTNTVYCVRFSHDGRLVAAGAADGALKVWNVRDRSPAWSSGTGGPAVTSLAFSPDNAHLAVARREGEIDLLDAATGGTPRRLLVGPNFPTWIGYSPDARTLAVCGGDSKIHLYDAATGSEIVSLSGHSSRVVEAAFSPDGSSLASVGVDHACIIWDLHTRAPRLRLDGHTAAVRAVCFSPDGANVATGSDDWTIRIWDTRTGRCIRTCTDVKQHVFGLAYHPSGNVLFSCCRDADIQVWDARTGKELATMEGHETPVLSLAISPDGRTLASASEDRTVGLWDLTYYHDHLVGNVGAWKQAEPVR